MMPGIIISFVFSEQNRLVFCTTPSENQLTSPKEPVDNAPNRLGIQVGAANLPGSTGSSLFVL